MTGRLMFPHWTQVTPAVLELYGVELDEDGAPVVACSWEGKGWYSAAAKVVNGRDGRSVTLAGVLVVAGDLCPALPLSGGGKAVVDGRSYRVHRIARPRNPDGSVHHTTVELV